MPSQGNQPRQRSTRMRRANERATGWEEEKITATAACSCILNATQRSVDFVEKSGGSKCGGARGFRMQRRFAVEPALPRCRRVPDGGAVNSGEQLCLACGLCCDGTLFDLVKLEGSDDARKLKA